MKTIKATIDRDGNVTINTIEGGGGPEECKALADKLAEFLGTADESTRADTDDLDLTGQETSGDLTIEE